MRFYLIDDFRALAIINMVIYHTLFDLVYVFGFNISWFLGPIGFVWEQYICWSFILIAGFCQYFSRHSLKEGLTVSFWGIVITLVTVSLNMGIEIYFGVLTFIGLAVLVTIPLKGFLKKLDPIIGLFLSILSFFFLRNINYHSFGFLELNLGSAPEWLYNLKPIWFFNLLGFTHYGFTSSDYFSFFPWYFLFLTGFFIYSLSYKAKTLDFFRIGKNKVFYKISKHSLLIYILHQPIIFGALYLFFH